MVEPLRVFVFGSNQLGRHGRGAAADAVRFHGAVAGIGSGPFGESYAIPTKDRDLRPLPLCAIAESVRAFKDFAAAHPAQEFEVTRLGCGLAGYADTEIAPLFADAPVNCVLPFLWQTMLGASADFRVIVAGSRGFADYPRLVERLDFYLRGRGDVVIVSGGARGADVLGEHYACDRGLRSLRFDAEWDRYGKAAGFVRNRRMSWASSALVAFWDGRSPGTRHMISAAREDRLLVKVVSF